MLVPPAVLLTLGPALAACRGEGVQPVRPPASGRPGQAISLTGAGATFPYPLYSKWFDVYEKQTGVRINYQSIGSGAGIRQIIERTVDFGASDAPMTDEQLAQAPGKILHIPTVLGAVVLTYNLPGVETRLNLTPDTVAGIFLGEITRWNDPRIARDNASARLPDSPIVAVYRSDGSGTTNVFTDYLSAISPAWKTRVGKGTSVNWPVGLGAKGNEGVTGQVKQLPGAIGYVELAYAVQNRLPYAFVQNQAGRFVEPTLDSTSAAAAGAAQSMPDDLRVSIVNAPGVESYPIAGFTYLLVYQEQADPAKGKALVDFLWWALHDGQQYARDLLYAPLPSEVIRKAEAKVTTITAQGRPLRGS
jgi:phosphate transport system substrate-binding protein